MHARDPETARIGEEVLPFEMGYLPEFYQKKAEVELNETPEKIVQYTRELKDCAKCEKQMAHFDFDDDFLLQYLRARKFDVGRAFVNLKSLVNFARKNPEMVTNFEFEETLRTVTDKVVNVLPWRCQDGCTIILVELDNWRPEIFSPDAVKRMSVVVLMQALQDPMTQVNGFKVIFDVKCTSLRYLRHCTPHNLHILYSGSMECAPGRFKEIHVVNDSLTFKTAWLIVKHFLSDKLRQRIHFHSSEKTLQDYFPKAVLPVAYGGELESYDQTAWLKRVMAPAELAKMGGGVFQDL